MRNKSRSRPADKLRNISQFFVSGNSSRFSFVSSLNQTGIHQAREKPGRQPRAVAGPKMPAIPPDGSFLQCRCSVSKVAALLVYGTHKAAERCALPRSKSTPYCLICARSLFLIASKHSKLKKPERLFRKVFPVQHIFLRNLSENFGGRRHARYRS